MCTQKEGVEDFTPFENENKLKSTVFVAYNFKLHTII